INNFRGERYYLGKALLPKFPCHRPENTGTLRLRCVLENHRSIVVELDMGAIRAPHALLGPDYNRPDYLPLLNNASWRGLFDGSNDYITQACVTLESAPKDPDAHDFFRACVICYFQSALWLDHVWSPPAWALDFSITSLILHRLRLDRGLVSASRTLSPMTVALSSSWAITFRVDLYRFL